MSNLTPAEIAAITEKANLLFPESPQGYIAAACEYAAEIKRLTEWKESANEILKNIDLQECGKALGLQPGADISKHILPAVIEIKRLREGIGKVIIEWPCFFYELFCPSITTTIKQPTMTQIKEVIHLYLGCECVHDGEYYTLKPSNLSNNWQSVECRHKPILRRLDSMTEDEGFELCESLGVFTPSHFIEAIKNNSKYIIDYRHSFEITAYLLKQGFDLFGLIDSGQAIDKNLKP